MSRLSRYIFAIFISIFVLVASIPVHAQTPVSNEAELRAELQQVEQEQALTQKVLEETQKQSGSLQRDITILDTKIKQAELTIKAKNILIKSLGKDIDQKDQTIQTLQERIDRSTESLSQIMRKINDLDTYTLPELVLSKDDLSDTLLDVDTFQSVQDSLRDLFTQIRDSKNQTQTERNVLDKRKNQEADARESIILQQKIIAENQKQKQALLAINKSQEKSYQQVIAEKQKKAAEIRAALFALRDTAAIPFAKALEYANIAARQTGIRPAFLLAILTQESNLGQNVGTCYVSDINTGDGYSSKNGAAKIRVMNPTRDIGIFMNITKGLGLNYINTKVSCWQPVYKYNKIRKPDGGYATEAQPIGWGGAMGPAQFIPSTWQLFTARVAKALGVTMPNPWSPQDAFMASAMYLTDLGASANSPTGERNAACKYYSGRTCPTDKTDTKDENKVIKSYGDQVMTKAQNIQDNMINLLIGS